MTEGLQADLTNRETDTARPVIEPAGVAFMFVRPLIYLDTSEHDDQGPARTFTHTATRPLPVEPTDAAEGHEPATLDNQPHPNGKAAATAENSCRTDGLLTAGDTP